MQYLIITGDPVTGFMFTGPLPTRDAAEQYAKQEMGLTRPEFRVGHMHPIRQEARG